MMGTLRSLHILDSMAGMWVVVVGLLMGGAMAQSVTPQNGTATTPNGGSSVAIRMEVSMGADMVPLATVIPLNRIAAGDIPPPGLSGPVVLANTSNYLTLEHDSVAIISCDLSAYPGNIGALNILNAAEQANASAVVWYSREADWCDFEAPYPYIASYPWLYSLSSANDTQKMLDGFDSLHVGDNDTNVYVTITQPQTVDQVGNGTSNGNGNGNNGNSQQNQNPLGPSPGTAVAMIILYSITGIITALFLVIIVTGAIRAHRHPERYGPRNIIGRPRQSRARGIARAMLETIPIVKFGDREEPKPTDIELADGAARNAQSEAREVTEGGQQSHQATDAAPADDSSAAAPRPSMAEGGIAAAANTKREGGDPDNQGCSICTEDFEIGQDQRVLPCNHRFHPDCIDPWLLNVSGTCPLCRIDLRPQTSRTSTEPELDEHGNPIPRGHGDETLPPPLGEDGPRRQSVRRSIIQGLIGIRPERMSREERLIALRQFRLQQAYESDRRRRESARASTAGAPEVAGQPSEQESRLRTRLRSAFRVRTRRTGQNEAADAEQPAASSSRDAERTREDDAAERPT